jgi:uncharacterized protein YbjT (DUF2867 family)
MSTAPQRTRVLVIGAYGFIGHALTNDLHQHGLNVIGFGRSKSATHLVNSPVTWRMGDLAALVTAEAWHPYVHDVDVIVNASGALQSGGKDDVAAAQDAAICALIDAAKAAGVTRIVQISAAGADANASTQFMRTKAAADTHLMASNIEWLILKPGLVIGADAYGGTALLRALAAFPLFVPLVHPSAKIQIIAMADLVETCRAAVLGELPSGTHTDLVHEEVHTLESLVISMRVWLGFSRTTRIVRIPRAIGLGVARVADSLAYLGWRSPLRSTALTTLAEGVVGQPTQPLRATTQRFASLNELLTQNPATLQERWFARCYLLMPLMLVTLAVFWITSGLVGLFEFDAALSVVRDRLPDYLATTLVVGGSLLDITLGVMVTVRRFARVACAGMVLTTLAYLVAGSWLTPELWLHPLGVFVKSIPSAVLALVASALIQER